MSAETTTLEAVRHIDVPQFSDQRGDLFALEHSRPVPFTPVRTFVITKVPEGKHRAQHVVSCDQFLWMVAGACQAVVRERAEPLSANERSFQLTARGPGLFLPEGVWLDLSNFSSDSVLLCLASAGYDAQRKR